MPLEIKALLDHHHFFWVSLKLISYVASYKKISFLAAIIAILYMLIYEQNCLHNTFLRSKDASRILNKDNGLKSNTT